MLNEAKARSLARTILFNDTINEMHMGPSNSNSGEFTSIHYGMYNQPGPDPDADREDLHSETMPIETNYVASVNYVEPTYDIDHITSDDYYPTTKNDLKKATTVFIDSFVEVDDKIEDVWQAIKKQIESFTGEKI